MMNNDLPSEEKFYKYHKLGLLDKREHPELPLKIYTYKHFTQAEHLWNRVTTKARGIVFDRNGRVIIRCVPKFFNDIEIESEIYRQPASKNVRFFEKLDGSLIQVAYDKQYGLVVTSKGSFTSDQVGWAKEILEETLPGDKHQYFAEGYSYIFELIHPENSEYLVVDYNDRKGLYLWAVVNNNTGREIDIFSKEYRDESPFDIVNEVDFEDYMKMRNVEGVVSFDGVNRVKYKTEQFLRNHRLIGNWTDKKIFTELKFGRSVEFDDLPEEFETWLNQTVKSLKQEYDAVSAAIDNNIRLSEGMSDKELANCQDISHNRITLAARKGRDVERNIWDLAWEKYKSKKNEEKK